MLTAQAPIDGDTILPLADARVHLNLTANDTFHDAAVTGARDAAISWTENYTGQSFQERDFLWETDQFRCEMRLPIGPVTEVTDVEYFDTAGADTALTDADWLLTAGVLSAAIGSTWPYGSGVRVTFTAGYAAAVDIPGNLLAAMKLAMTAFFENRSDPDLAGAMRVADQLRPVL
jgi:uncharacterized phiE125 gp8 family phage protein